MACLQSWETCSMSWIMFALAERKIHLLLLPQYGSGLVNWLEKERILNMFSIEEEMYQHQAGSITEAIYYDKLFEAHQWLCSSGETLKAAASSVQAFCFQRWFVSLRAKVIRIVGGILKLLVNISYCDSTDSPKLGTNDTLAIHETVKDFSKLSLRLERLSQEFDLIITTFIGMDAGSSNIISALALNCSLLAFCTGFAFHAPNLATTLVNETVEDPGTNLQAVLIQNLIGRLWLVDGETSKKLTQLLEVMGGASNCLHLLSRNHMLDVGYEVRDILTLCRYAVSEVVGLQSKANEVNGGTLQVIKDGVRLLSIILMPWISIPFRVPKCFFCVRPCIGSELFSTTDARKPDGISIPCGVHLSLNLCLQLRNITPNMSVKITKLYCILYSGLSFQEPRHSSENNAQEQQGYDEAWENDDMVEMQNKLYCYVTKLSKNEANIGKCRTSSLRTTERQLIQAFAQFEPNQKGQGFSNCLLDVSRFPVGCYRIKWYSCCVDSEGSLWSLLPLNFGPSFTIH